MRNLLQTAISSSIKHVLNEAPIAFNFSSFGYLLDCLTLFLQHTSQGGAVINKFIYRAVSSVIFPFVQSPLFMVQFSHNNRFSWFNGKSHLKGEWLIVYMHKYIIYSFFLIGQ